MKEKVFSEILKDLRYALGISQVDMALRLEMSLRMYSDYETGKFDAGGQDIRRKKILKKIAAIESELKDAEPQLGFLRKGNIMFVPLKAYGGFLQDYENKVFTDSLQRFSLPGITGEHYAFEVDGMSMYDVAAPRDWAIAYEERAEYMVKGKMYVLQTIDGIILKYFDRIEGAEIGKPIPETAKVWFYSKNPEYKPFFIKAKELKKIYSVNHILKKQ